MPHTLLLDTSPNSFALIVVLGMAMTGFVLGTVLDRLMSWLGIAGSAKGSSR